MGTSVMWQMGHSPGSSETTWGCIGHWYFTFGASLLPGVTCECCPSTYDVQVQRAAAPAMATNTQRTIAIVRTPRGGGSGASSAWIGGRGAESPDAFEELGS